MSIRPIWSACSSTSSRSGLTRATSRQNPSARRSVFPCAHRGLDPVQRASDLGRCSCPNLHGSAPSDRRIAPGRALLATPSASPNGRRHHVQEYDPPGASGWDRRPCTRHPRRALHIVERIAAGGMGEVFLAHDAVLAREVAIKVLHRSLAGDQAFVDRFRREARAAAGLSHPNIVAVYDWGAVDGIYYMVMEYVRGRGVPRPAEPVRQARARPGVPRSCARPCSRSATRTRRASCTATSSPRTSSSRPTAS